MPAGFAAAQMPQWVNRYHHNHQHENADQAEWQAVLAGTANILAGTMDDEMSEAADDDALLADHESERLQDKEVVREATQGPVAEVISERTRLLGSAYPFELAGNSLIYRPSPTPIYELLLGISQAPSLTTGDYTVLPRIFEQISVLAGQGYMGARADGIRTGWPRPDTHARFQSLIASVKTAAAPGDHDPEWHWCPEPGLPDDPAPKFVKEEGLDLVVWRAWIDGRGSPLYLLGQCSCGSNWMDKGSDIHLPTLERWFRTWSVPPVRSLFVPRNVTGSLMREMSQRSGLIFDRIRIIHALSAEHIAPKVDALASDIENAFEVAKTGQLPSKAVAASKPRRRFVNPKRQEAHSPRP